MMKYYVALTLFIVLAGCQVQSPESNTPTTPVNTQPINATIPVSTETFWLEYHPAQCEQLPWTTNAAPSVVSTYYQSQYNIVVHAIEVNAAPAGFISCQACGCPTGESISIQTNTAGKEILLRNGFVEPTVSAAEIAQDETIQNQTIQDVELDLSADDQVLADQVALVQSYLKDYFRTHQSYPNDLSGLSNIDLSGLHYTPIGTLPASYYDLSVDYSTGNVVVNP